MRPKKGNDRKSRGVGDFFIPSQGLKSTKDFSIELPSGETSIFQRQQRGCQGLRLLGGNRVWMHISDAPTFIDHKMTIEAERWQIKRS